MVYCIYKIVCNDINVTEFYIGSTLAFRKRKYQHKNSCKDEKQKSYKFKIYQTIRDNGGWDNWRMVIIEEMKEGTTTVQARIREEHYRVELQSTLNTYSAYDKQIEKYKEYQKEWRETNKDEQKEYMKEYQLTEKYKQYKKEYMKEYRKKQKELSLIK
jgi:hypothetical protein